MSKTYPIISIVTPSFNQGAYLEETICSVLDQNYPNLQYFIIDGGSQDKSLDIIRRYQKHLTYWESSPDLGQAHALNKGFLRSTGQIMAWLNSDDLYAPGALFVVAEILSDRQRSMAVGDSLTSTSPGTSIGTLDRRRPTWDAMVFELRTFPQPSVFWTHDLWDRAGPLDEKLFISLDYDLWIRMRWKALNLFFIDQVLSFARVHQEQKMNLVRTGKFENFTRERVYIALKNLRLRGQNPYVWLMHSWFRRLLLSIQRRSFKTLTGSVHHRLATRMVFSRSWEEDYQP